MDHWYQILLTISKTLSGRTIPGGQVYERSAAGQVRLMSSTSNGVTCFMIISLQLQSLLSSTLRQFICQNNICYLWKVCCRSLLPIVWRLEISGEFVFKLRFTVPEHSWRHLLVLPQHQMSTSLWSQLGLSSFLNQNGGFNFFLGREIELIVLKTLQNWLQ